MTNLRGAMSLAVIFAPGSTIIWSAGVQSVPDDEGIEGLKRETRVLNLVNGLSLTPEQMGRIVSITDRVRALDEAEFAIQKEDLAEELPALLQPEIPAGQLDRKIEGFLLSREMIRLLEERLSVNPLNG